MIVFGLSNGHALISYRQGFRDANATLSFAASIERACRVVTLVFGRSNMHKVQVKEEPELENANRR